MPKITIGILGFGRFGRLVQRVLVTQKIYDFDHIWVHDAVPHPLVVVELVSFQQAVGADIIIPCVPISQFEAVIKRMAAHLPRKRQLIIDVCSVKVHPARVMRQNLPRSVDIIATHPLFGPDSAEETIQDLPLVIHPVRIRTGYFAEVFRFLELLGLNVIRMSPEDHDRAMAYSQAFTHLVGRIGERIDLKPTGIDTKGFQQLLKIQHYVVNDRMQLFYDMLKYNPYVGEMIHHVKAALADFERHIA